MVRDGQQVLWLLAYRWSRAKHRTAVGLMGASSIHSGMMAKYVSAVSLCVVCSSMTAVSFPVVHASGNCGRCAGVFVSVHLLSGLCVYSAVVGLLLVVDG